MTTMTASAVVRRADDRDIDELVAMGLRFHQGSRYADHFTLDEVRCHMTVGWLLAHGAIFVAERDGALVGMLGVAVMPHLMSGVLQATEVFWWVDLKARGQGLRLLRAAEQWAKQEGADTMNLIAPDVRAEELYQRLGYTKVETAYMRRVE